MKRSKQNRRKALLLQKLAVVIASSAVVLVFFYFENTSGLFAPQKPTPTPEPIIGKTILWPDIPALQGAQPDLASNGFSNSGDPEKSSDFTYYTDLQPADIVAFYTNKRMAALGWQPESFGLVKRFSAGHGEGAQQPYGSTPSGCFVEIVKNEPNGSCAFGRVDDQGNKVSLTISANLEPKAKKTSVWYIRSVTVESQP
jgi:hypothetical protein